MATVIRKLNDIINKDIIFLGSVSGSALMKGHKLSIYITNFSDTTSEERILLKIDNNNPHSSKKTNTSMLPFFRTDVTHPHNRICDYVLIQEESGILKVLLIELKTSNIDGASSQLRNTKCLVKLILDMMNEFYDIKTNAEFRCVVLKNNTNEKIRKRKVSTRLEKPNKDMKSPSVIDVRGKKEINISFLMW